MTKTELYRELFNYYVSGSPKLNLGYCYLYGVFTEADQEKGLEILKAHNVNLDSCKSKEDWLISLVYSTSGPILYNKQAYICSFGESAALGEDGFDGTPKLVDLCLRIALRNGMSFDEKILRAWHRTSKLDFPVMYLGSIKKNGAEVCSIRNLNFLKNHCFDGSIKAAKTIGEIMIYKGAALKAVDWVKRVIVDNEPKIIAKTMNEFCYSIGMYYEEHHDIERALLWYEKAFFEVGTFYKKNYGRFFDVYEEFNEQRPDDPILLVKDKLGLNALNCLEKKLKWWKTAAEDGSILANNEVALAYYLGTLTRKNKRKALNYFYKAFVFCNQKNISEKIVKAYWNKNTYLQEILHWIADLAHKGIREAQYCLAGTYIYGLWGRYNLSRALEWYRRAADNGDPNANLMLGN